MSGEVGQPVVAPTCHTDGVPGFSAELITVPWDSAVFGCVVKELRLSRKTQTIDGLRVREALQDWLRAEGADVVYCRLPASEVESSFVLADLSFRSIETVLHPTLKELPAKVFEEEGISVARAVSADVPTLSRIAGHAFSHERYHVDPRFPNDLANARYARWVEAAVDHPSQKLYKLSESGRTIGLFIVEDHPESVTTWHLTALAPNSSGGGMGARAWRAMLAKHQQDGRQAVHTTISARNSRVLGLYSKLNFRFLQPEVTMHWVSPTFAGFSR